MEPVYRKVARNFGLSQAQTLYKVVFPAAFPQIMNSLRLALGTAWIFLVSGEMVGAQSGLGFLIMDAKNCLRSDALLATMITIGVIGLLLDNIPAVTLPFEYTVLICPLVVAWYILTELGSIIENAGLMGVPIPAALTKAIDVLNAKANQEERDHE